MIFRTVLVFLVLSFASAFAAGSSSGGGDSNNSESLYKSSVSLIKRAGKLEKKIIKKKPKNYILKHLKN